MDEPRVSIGLPVYNGERYLRRALDSILAQDFKDFELIISDNASTDQTAVICREYGKRDSRIRFYQNDTNIGADPNHNRVFELARAQYFKWAAHDDECMPGLLGRCVEALDRSPEVVLAYPKAELIDENNQVMAINSSLIASDYTRPHRRLARVLYRVVWSIPGYGLHRSEALRKTRLVDSFVSSDYILFAELAMLGRIVEVPEVLFRRRLHAGRSFVAHPTKKALRKFLDPAKAKDLDPLPTRERLVWEYIRSGWKLPLCPMDRILCTITAPCVVYTRIFMRMVTPLKSTTDKFLHKDAPHAKVEAQKGTVTLP